MFTDLYLRFSDEAEANSILYTEVPTAWDEEGNVTESYTKPNYANIDTIGVIYQPQDIPDPENPPEPVPLDGWHVNVRVVDGEDATPLEVYKVIVSTPMRVWG